MDNLKLTNTNSFNNTLSLLTEPLYTMTIELNQGKSSKIKIFPNSHPEQLAFDFCKTNNLDYSAMNYISENIKILLDSFKNSLTEHNNNNNNPSNNNNTHNINKSKSLSSQNIFKKTNNNEDTNVIYNTITDIPYNTDTSLLNNSKKTFSTINKSSLTNEPHTLFSYESFFKNKLNSKQTNTSTNTDNNNTNNKDKPKSKYISSSNKNKSKHNNSKSLLTNNYYTRQISPDDNNNNNEQQVLQSLLLSKNNSKHNITTKTSPTKTSSNDNHNHNNNHYHNGNNTSTYNRNEVNTYLHTEPYPTTNISKLKLDLSTKSNPTSTYQPFLHKPHKHPPHLNHTTTDTTTYTFKPTLNKHSIALIKKHPHLQSSFLTHHHHNTPNLKRIETEMYKNCSFIPKCTKYPGCDSLLPFYERQKIYNTRSQEKIKKLQTQTNDHIDHKTGQEYFKPLLYKDKYHIKRDKSEKVFQRLYDYRLKYNHTYNTSKSVSKDDNVYLTNTKFKSNSSSCKMLLKKKNSMFENIFNVLDSDNDGVINAINACKWKIPDNVVNILKDVFDEMKETRMEYNKDEFVEMCLDIYDELNNDERKLLLNYNKELVSYTNTNKQKDNINNNNVFTFKPQLNKNSMKILSDLNRKKQATSNRLFKHKRDNSAYSSTNTNNNNYTKYFTNKNSYVSLIG